MKATLSVCCMANSPGPFLRAALAPLRELADEIVIAAGGPLSEDDLRYYGEIADKLYSIEFEFVERHLAWLYAQCSGDWILRLDGDEIPSPELIAEVRAATEERGLNSLIFARRNLFPTIGTYIAQEPWYPDFQVRMVRNDGSLRFSGLTHSAAERVLPARMTEAAIYHLPFVLSALDERRARAGRYERFRPGLVAPTGLPANAALLPESLPNLLTAAVPGEHRQLIETVLSASGPAHGTSERVTVSLAEMDAHWSGRTLDESAYRASITVLGATVPLAPEENRPFYFQVRNEGSERWGWDPAVGPHLHVVHRFLQEDGTAVDDWRPSFFTEWIGPGCTTIVPAHVQAPSLPGRYRLDIRVRHAPQERLFGTAEAPTLDVRPGGAWGSLGALDGARATPDR
jgi:hypothetical protein